MISFLLSLAALAIPIVIAAKIARRVKQVTGRLDDPIRLQHVFAQSAAAALRRTGADPRAVAKLEVLGQGPAVDRAADLNAAAYEARIGLQRKGGYAAQPRPPAAAAPEPQSRLFEEEPRSQPLRRPQRPRPQAPVSRGGGLDMGDQFRLSEPPETGEPRGPVAFANWIAAALFAGAAAYYLFG